MIKQIATDDHPEMVVENDGVTIQFYGLGGLTKSASDAFSRETLQALKPDDRHFGVHAVTMGSEDYFGYNRNGDSASERALKLYHPTFEKFGCVYKEHRNKNPKTQGIGIIKKAAYNDRAHRGELFFWINKDKDPEGYEMAKQAKELSFSMSLRIPYDECSVCKKKSRRRKDYCSHLKNHLRQYIPSLKKYAYARNEDNVMFYDMSRVKRRADRIAAALGYSFDDEQGLAKAASEMVIGGAQWASFDSPEVVAFSPWEKVLLTKFAEAEDEMTWMDDRNLQVLRGMAPKTLNYDTSRKLAEHDFGMWAGKLAKRAMFIDFPTFCQVLLDKPATDLEADPEFCDAQATKLPEVFSDMLDAGGCGCGEAASMVSPHEFGDQMQGGDEIDRMMSEFGTDLSIKPVDATSRGLSVTIVKSAGQKPVSGPVTPFWNAMVEAYGTYLLKTARVIVSNPAGRHLPVSIETLMCASNRKY